MKILESAENYLEAIKMISNDKGKVKAVDIAKFLNFSKPSVSIAIKLLKENEYIFIQENGNIMLTEKGDKIAFEMCERHKMLTDFLMALGVSRETAKTDACRIEHYISKETFEKIKEHCIPRIKT